MFNEGVLSTSMDDIEGAVKLNGFEKNVRYAFDAEMKILLSVTATNKVDTKESTEGYISSERAFMHAVKGAFTGVPDKVIIMLIQALSERLNDSFDERGRLKVDQIPEVAAINLNNISARDSLLNLNADEVRDIPQPELEVTEVSMDDFNKHK